MQLVKRAVIGGYVQADTTGLGDFEVGKITSFDKDSITFQSAKDGESITIDRSHAVKATAKQYEEALGGSIVGTEDVASGQGSDSEPEAKKDTSESVGAKDAKKVRRGGKTRFVCPECCSTNLQRRKGYESTSHRCGDCKTDFNMPTRNVLHDYYGCYQEHRTVRTASGRPATDKGDEVASILRGMSLDQVMRLTAPILGTTPEALEMRYAHLNPGMQRMNIGNRIRKLLKDNEIDISQLR